MCLTLAIRIYLPRATRTSCLCIHIIVPGEFSDRARYGSVDHLQFFGDRACRASLLVQEVNNTFFSGGADDHCEERCGLSSGKRFMIIVQMDDEK